MITPTHIVVNTAATRIPKLKAKLDNSSSKWFIIGGLAPDLFLYIASLVGYGYYSAATTLTNRQIFNLLYDDLFYNNPVWIVGQNFLHAPLVIVGLYLIARAKNWVYLKWFALGCGLHSLLDIFTHHNDGPLLFFPFDWSYRFSSPISYWDPDHFGDVVGSIDLTITVVGSLVFLVLWLKRRYHD